MITYKISLKQRQEEKNRNKATFYYSDMYISSFITILKYNLLCFIMPNFLYFERVAEEQMLTYTILEDRPLHFAFLDKGSQRGRHLLVDSRGYSYGVKVRTR